MNISERRIIGSLLLLLGVSLLIVAMQTGQLDKIIEMLETGFPTIT
ncbi:MAG: hypothetical protein PVF96_02980 [Candidatus Bathyarchaeota archaeon]|jgi:hypothetical protein